MKFQQFQYVRRVPYCRIRGDVAVCADCAEQLGVAECRKIGEGKGVVDAGVHVKNEFVRAHGMLLSSILA